MKRVFISIDIPKDIQNKIKKIQDSLPEFYGKKTETENLHLTLKFLGETPDDTITLIKEKLKKISFQRFETSIGELGFFSEKFIRIIWLHMSNCDVLQKTVDDVLADLFERERRFMGHLTIARVKKIHDKKEFVENLKKIKIPKISFVVTNFTLKESILLRDKPVYKTLAKYNLK